MLTAKDREEKYRGLEKVRRIRIENLRRLAETLGSMQELGKRAGLSASFTSAIAGVNPRRNIGEALARSIETQLKLPHLWLDIKH